MVVFKSKGDTAANTTTTTDTTAPSESAAPKTTVLKPIETKVTPSQFDTSPIWESVAKSYDNEIGWDERVMGIGLLRRWLVSQAKGDVLEVSTGTGRNFSYYKPESITSATFTDRHPPMLEEAKHKFEKQPKPWNVEANFITANVDDPKSMPQGFDTVVDTFGLCSCGDPVEALVSLADACKSEDSRILLLEHGRSHYDWLNRLLDTNVDKHVTRWGCWWNRDMVGLLEDKRVKEKMEVVSMYRWHFGTTCYIVAKPKRSPTETK
ncbi:S-adenosyl-L-methionine-dependent methyltransferase [Phycomyces blakesleeanus]|uniref:Methyltransferase type 12 domain-containing protein n=2 Tax=Phycomyces blakesleeanus TaxID=4837 RepID=A0A167K3J4_PHYB8|nr:hypothetical protein PHYBLDRAFT_32217 [Phycomyces blakesleeanus NRRL 1555(-)]OAD67206.1 hypothetical protein PHYBLDRAFT_32217 [Phycomyces blakesleeanus NRRL 1555(-)]|eukprot:XP_018285246.1 hypothetical protein PHYBLDRAFT_32217 [Phycomyces blakesleeanus NRRL 1555(-)]